MTARQTHETGKKKGKPGFLERAIDDLEEHFERGEQGDETGHERPDVEDAREKKEHKLDAEHFRHLTEQCEQKKEEKREEQRDAAAEEREERVKELSERHIDDAHWSDLMRLAREAAKAGNEEFQLLRFPSQLCSDGGRAINANEEGWEKSLRGEAKELYQRWKKKLKPHGFRLTARILDFPDGFPGDAGLCLTWKR